jgi:hypothetical protein
VPLGLHWAEGLFSKQPSILYDKIFTLSKSNISPEQFSKALSELASEFGEPKKVSFIRAQFFAIYLCAV